jgi:[citrate (pro-3S)-lyase] ligase
VYVFVLSEDKSQFSAKDRLEMVKLGVSHIKNVTVLQTGPYLISSATFPTYFIKERESAAEAQCLLDIEIFAKYFAPAFSITKRYVGSEPYSPITEKYNRALSEHLPKKGIDLIEIERTCAAGTPISASVVRECIANKQIDRLCMLVPKTTLKYLTNNNLI